MKDLSKLGLKHVSSIPPPIIDTNSILFLQVDHPKHSIQQLSTLRSKHVSRSSGVIPPPITASRPHPFPRGRLRAAYLQGQPSSLNIIDAAIQHFLLAILPSMVLPIWQEYNSSLSRTADALLFVTV